MVCNACFRTVNPSRSFCPNCGSAVFIDENESRARARQEIARAVEPLKRRDDGLSPPARVQQPPVVQRPKLPRASVPSMPSPSIGCGGCLVRLALLAAVVYYGGRWLLSISEVRTAFDALLAGSVSDDQINAAVSAVRAHLFQWLGVSP